MTGGRIILQQEQVFQQIPVLNATLQVLQLINTPSMQKLYRGAQSQDLVLSNRLQRCSAAIPPKASGTPPKPFQCKERSCTLIMPFPLAPTSSSLPSPQAGTGFVYFGV